MQLSSVDTVHFPVELVFSTFRDRLEKLIPFLPNVEDIKVLEREELAPGHVRLVNHWRGKAPVPAAAKAFLTEEMFSWKDHAEWWDDGFRCKWRLETFYLNNLFHCDGQTLYQPKGDKVTEIHLSGDLQINIDAIRAIPSFLRSSVKPQVEKFVIGLVTPNLTSVATGLNKFLMSQEAGR